jgi:hypothetical protein
MTFKNELLRWSVKVGFPIVALPVVANFSGVLIAESSTGSRR